MGDGHCIGMRTAVFRRLGWQMTIFIEAASSPLGPGRGRAARLGWKPHHRHHLDQSWHYTIHMSPSQKKQNIRRISTNSKDVPMIYLLVDIEVLDEVVLLHPVQVSIKSPGNPTALLLDIIFGRKLFLSKYSNLVPSCSSWCHSHGNGCNKAVFLPCSCWLLVPTVPNLPPWFILWNTNDSIPQIIFRLHKKCLSLFPSLTCTALAACVSWLSLAQLTVSGGASRLTSHPAPAVAGGSHHASALAARPVCFPADSAEPEHAQKHSFRGYIVRNLEFKLSLGPSIHIL